jgi:hypothetical protein
MSRETETTVANDTIWGVSGKDGIAAYIGRKPSQAYYLIEKNKLPVKKHGHRTITASRAQLRRLFSGDRSA